MHVTVVSAAREAATIVELEVPAGTTVRNAAERARLADVDLARCAFGVHGQRCKPGRFVRDGDRVEIYRPLLNDPKTRRRLRARAPRGPSGDTD